MGGKVVLIFGGQVQWRTTYNTLRTDSVNSLSYCPDPETIAAEMSAIRRRLGLPVDYNEA
jgi:hypothetical protein